MGELVAGWGLDDARRVSRGANGTGCDRAADRDRKLRIRTEPDEERAELREIYRAKGLEGTLLEDVVADLTSTKERWLAAMIRDEHGIVTSERENPLARGIRVGGAFVSAVSCP